MQPALIQNQPLLISSIIEYAAANHGQQEVVSRLVEGSIHRTNYQNVHLRSKQAALALTEILNAKPGDRIGTLAWNTHRHLELYFGVSGAGLVLHTINPRLFPEQIDFIINHAQDSVLFVDLSFISLLENLGDKIKVVKTFVILTDEAHMPKNIKLSGSVWSYETLLQKIAQPKAKAYKWPVFDENSASVLCYTSGTTGNPKGVLYGHRSTLLHSFACLSRDGLGIHSGDALFVIVPLFHASAWGLPYAAAMCGARLVFPGPLMDGASIWELIQLEKPTFMAAVPSVFLTTLQYLDEHPEINHQRTIERVLIGGSAVPREMARQIKNRLGARTVQAWGMTETHPIVTVGNFLPKHKNYDEEQQLDVITKQGRIVFGVEMKITDDQNVELPRDGQKFGELKVRGHWITNSYYKTEKPNVDAENWFSTGDVGTIDADGYMHITDRSKDVIKSGGEWISSIDLENTAIGHPAVAEAAVVGVRHLKWQERPLLIVVLKKHTSTTREDILEFLKGKVISWWLPDDVVFVSELPHTATGKLLKTALRETYKDHLINKAKL